MSGRGGRRECGLHATRIAAFVVACFAILAPSGAHAQRAPQPIAPNAPHALPLAEPVESSTFFHVPDVQERYTRRGAIIGAIIGAAGGLGFGTLIALFCEAESDDGCWGVPPLLGLAGALGGGLVGGIIGAAVPREGGESPAEAEEPRDRPINRPSDAPPGQRPDTARGPTSYDEVFAPPPRTGSFALAAGYADASVADILEGSGPAVRLHVSAEVRPWLSIGLEGGQSFLGDAGDVQHAAITLRGTLPRRHVSPYLNGNLGYYAMTEPSLEFFGGSLGLGVRVAPREHSRWFIDVEARHSRNLQNIEPLRMNALLAGTGWYW